MKAWFVIASTADYGAFVWAETRNAGRLIGMEELGYFKDDYLDTKATRYPALDNQAATEGVIPRETCFNAGCGWMCEGDWCDVMTSKRDGGRIVDGEILCEGCAEATSAKQEAA